MSKANGSGHSNGQSARTSALTSAAAALESELRRYVDLTATVVKIPVTSEATLNRASKALLEAAESEQRVVGYVKGLLEAINGVREMQESSTAALNERAVLITQRRDELDALLARFSKLGEVGQSLNAALQKVVAYKPDPYGTAEDVAEVSSALDAIANGMNTCADHAGDLATEARSKSFEDLSRQADGLRHQILSAKNRLALVQKGFAR